MTRYELAELLRDTERAHALSGDPASNWPEWYADYIITRAESINPRWRLEYGCLVHDETTQENNRTTPITRTSKQG